MGFVGTLRRWSFVCSLIAVVPACSGGSGGGGPGALQAGLPPNTTPTATLTASQSNASALELEIQDGAQQMAKVAANSNNLPGTALTGGVEESLQCSSLSGTGSGSGSISINEPDNGTLAAGTEVEIDYNNCTFSSDGISETINGSIREQYTRYASATDFTVVLAADITATVDGSTVSEDFNETLDISNGTETLSYTASNGGSLVVSASDVTTSGNDVTISNATYTYQSSAAGGIVKAVFNNWEYDSSTGHAIGGTVTITGANATAVITASPTGYTVNYTSASGTTSTYTVTY